MCLGGGRVPAWVGGGWLEGVFWGEGGDVRGSCMMLGIVARRSRLNVVRNKSIRGRPSYGYAYSWNL